MGGDPHPLFNLHSTSLQRYSHPCQFHIYKCLLQRFDTVEHTQKEYLPYQKEKPTLEIWKQRPVPSFPRGLLGGGHLPLEWWSSKYFLNPQGIASRVTNLYTCRTGMETHPTAPQHTPRTCVLAPTSRQTHSLGLCETAEAVTLFPPFFLTRKWLTHVYHVPIYQQIISPVFWDLVTGPISCELPNNVYNQLLMALLFCDIWAISECQRVPYLTYIWLRRSCTFPFPMASLQVRGGASDLLNYPFWTRCVPLQSGFGTPIVNRLMGTYLMMRKNMPFEMIKLSPIIKGKSL